MLTSSGLNRSTPILIAIAAASLCAAVYGQGKQAETKRPVFSLTIQPVNETVEIGSPVLVEITTENTSRKNILVWRENALDQGGLVYKVDAWDDKGLPAAETETGRELQGHVPPGEVPRERRVLFFSGGFIQLAPSKTITDKVDVSRLFSLGVPGKYLIQFHRFDNHSLCEVRSNKVTVALLPKQQKQD